MSENPHNLLCKFLKNVHNRAIVVSLINTKVLCAFRGKRRSRVYA
jgi:hypothetical protein